MSGKLYLVATPIGNLEDITIRAINILNTVDLIAAEDTRHTLKLLNHFKINKHLISYHRHNQEVKTKVLIEKLKSGENIALVSDAGTPIISDPGDEIVSEAIKENIEIISIPGPCAAITGLIASGIDAKQFTFIGFLPMNKKLRKEKLEEIKKESRTIILYEAPHKILNTLEELKDITQDRVIVLAKELTKIHEEYLRGTAEELLKKLLIPKGEFVIIIEKSNTTNNIEKELLDLDLEKHYKYYENMGYEKKEIIKKIAKDRKVSKNDIYINFIKKS